MAFYFAYGSNLCSRDLRNWSQRAGFKYPLVKKHAKAYLPDWEYVFNYYSNTRKAGALNIRPRCGQLVAGVLFEVAKDGWIALDVKEGANTRYARREITVLKEDGSQQKAITYIVTPEYETSATPPSQEYLQIVVEGLEEHQLEGKEQFLAAAQIQPSSFLLDRVFFYGTLMQGESNFDAYLGSFKKLTFTVATINGFLVDFGPYPGLLLHPNKTVTGELITYQNIGELLDKVDPLEGFYGYNQLEKAFYKRVLAQIKTNAETHLAWTYILTKHPKGIKVIESGNWRVRK